MKNWRQCSNIKKRRLFKVRRRVTVRMIWYNQNIYAFRTQVTLIRTCVAFVGANNQFRNAAPLKTQMTPMFKATGKHVPVPQNLSELICTSKSWLNFRRTPVWPRWKISDFTHVVGLVLGLAGWGSIRDKNIPLVCRGQMEIIWNFHYRRHLLPWYQV